MHNGFKMRPGSKSLFLPQNSNQHVQGVRVFIYGSTGFCEDGFPLSSRFSEGLTVSKSFLAYAFAKKTEKEDQHDSMLFLRSLD